MKVGTENYIDLYHEMTSFSKTRQFVLQVYYYLSGKVVRNISQLMIAYS